MSLLSVAPPPPTPTSLFPCAYSTTRTRVHLHHHGPSTFAKCPVIPLASPSSPSSVVEDDSIRAPSDDGLPFGGCKACGREEVERGCDGEGRIQGGIATVPGFGWWPIKAYRPCPGFLASGGRYTRQGQTMDEVAFGRGERGSAGDNEGQSSQKKQGPRRFKR